MSIDKDRLSRMFPHRATVMSAPPDSEMGKMLARESALMSRATELQVELDGVQAQLSDVLEMPLDAVAGTDNLYLGDAEIEIAGCARPNKPVIGAVGDFSSGATYYQMRVCAVDAAGRRSVASYPSDVITTGPATLSSTRYATLSWVAVPGAVSYQVYLAQNTPGYDGANWKMVNAFGAFTSATSFKLNSTVPAPFADALPSFNESGIVDLRGTVRINGAAEPKIYKAVINQSGTSAPVATVLVNSLGGTPVFTRSGSGAYRLTLNGAFVTDRTFITPNSFTADTGDPISIIWASTSVIQFNSGADDTINSLMFEISVYPA
jgi:hypothetical protein